MENLNIIVKTIFGSHLYGTNTELSDMDYKGVFMPTGEQVLLGRIPKNVSFSTARTGEGRKNQPWDVDTEIYSFHYFIKLACEGQTIALDMLYTPDDMILESSQIWEDIVANRNRFLTKNLKAFVGYARKQAAKYGIKGSRLEAAERAKKFLELQIEMGFIEKRLKEVWGFLPGGEHIFFGTDKMGLPTYEVCGRQIQETVSIGYAYSILEKFCENYGERAKAAKESKGIDWKAISHALRAAFEVEEILEHGTITFPLRLAEYLKSVKWGELDYTTEVAPTLEATMDKLERLSELSDLPKNVDREFWDDFVVRKTYRSVWRKFYKHGDENNV